MNSPLLTERQKAAVLWAEHVTKNTARSSDNVFEQVRKVFSEAEIVELTFISGMFNMLNRFMDSLHVPLEDQSDVNKIKKSVMVNTDKLKEYFQFVLDNWPEQFPEPNPDG